MPAARFSPILALLIAVSTFAGAQTDSSAQSSKILNWQECMAIAARQNPQLLSALHSLEASQYQYSGSFNGLMPNLSLNNSYSNSDTLASLGKFGDLEHYTESANLGLNLLSAQSFATISTDKALRVQAQANLRLISATVRLNLYLAFISVLYYQKKIAVDRQIMDLDSDDADMVTLEYKSGQESKGDMLTSQANLYQAQLTFDYDKLNMRAAEITLDQQLGDDAFDLRGAAGTLDISSTTIPDFASMVDHNPQILVSEAGVVLAKAGLQTSEVAIFPAFSASASRSYNGPTELPTTPHWSVGAVLSLPIFGNGPTATYYQILSSRKSVAAAKETLRASRESVRSALENDWQNMVQAVDVVMYDEKQLEAAQLRNDESTIRYNTGEMPYETWIIAVQNLVSAKQTLLSAQQSAAQYEAQWESAQGLVLGE